MDKIIEYAQLLQSSARDTNTDLDWKDALVYAEYYINEIEKNKRRYI